jgi:hypothetical protein
MEVGARPALTFAVLEAKIAEFPEGPVSALNTPRWARLLSALGVFGVIAAFMPSVLLTWLEPQWWMVRVAQSGLALVVVGFVPGMLRSVWVLAGDLRHHRAGMIEQFDHDVAQAQRIARWLSGYPRQTLEECLRYARMGQERLQSRLVMLLGGIDRLGLLPILASLFLLFRNRQDLLQLPGWLAALGAMAAFLWLLGWLGAEFSRRLQLYASLLEEALTVGDARAPLGGSP